MSIEPLRVLLVEDDEDDVELTRRALMSGPRGCEIEAVGRLSEAVRSLERTPPSTS